MTPALRLVVAWMMGVVATLCVVALAAWRGQLWFHDTRVACPAALPRAVEMLSRAAPADAPPDGIVKYLRARFDEGELRPDGDLAVGVAYMGAPLVEVDSQRLRRLLPDTHFFTTKLQGGQMEHWDVELLVSFRRTAGGDDIRSSTLATFDSPFHGFLSQFIGIRASTFESRREVALAVAELLAKASYGAEARSSRHGFYGTRAEIWHGRQHWRDVDVFSDRNGLVKRILILNPIDRRLETIVSSF